MAPTLPGLIEQAQALASTPALEEAIAEVLTALAESCQVCSTSEGGLCPSCSVLSATAAGHRLRASQLRQGALA